VVDDNYFNIVPVMHMIKGNFGIDIDTAENGLMAVKKYTHMLNKKCMCPLRLYRLIIMDI